MAIMKFDLEITLNERSSVTGTKLVLVITHDCLLRMWFISGGTCDFDYDDDGD